MTGSEFARIGGSYNTAYICTYQVIEQNVGGNYTVFRLYGYFYYGGGTQVSSQTSGGFYLDGNYIYGASYTFGPGYHLLGTKDITVYHNNDGSYPGRYVGISAQSWHMSGSTGGNIYAGNITRQAYVTGATDFNDEGNPRITFTNPAGFRINARLEFAGTVIRRDNIANTGSYTFNLTEEERNLLRSKTPNSNKLTVREVIATCISGTAESYWSWQDKTMTIVNANPTFSNFEFEDVNPITLALTGNNQNIIQGYSTVKATIPVEYIATANKYATMSKYSFTCSDVQRDITYSSDSSTNNTIENVKSGVFNVYAIDSRNNSTLVTKNANETIAYNPLVKGNISIARQNGVAEETNLTISGTIDLVDFGDVVNSVQEAKYRYKITDGSTWSNYTDITVSVDNDGNITFNDLIEGDTGDGFDIGHSYNIEVLISDELSTIVYTANLGSGIPNIALHKNGVGIMGKYDTTEGGLLQIAGKKIYAEEVIYENTSGNTGNITLSENISKYKKIKIFGKNSDIGTDKVQYYPAQEFFTNNDNDIQIQLSWTSNGNGIVYPAGTYYGINNTSMTILFHYRIGLYGANQGYAGTDNRYAITKIVGYY